MPKTVGQCTGEALASEEIIFEGDIVKCPLGEPDTVIYKRGMFMLRRRNISLKRFVDELSQSFEIIGNIHQNPELITQSPKT